MPSQTFPLRVAVAGMGLAGEAAEVLEVVRRGAATEEVISEIGDVAWYGAEVASTLGIQLNTLDIHPADSDDDARGLSEDIVIHAGRTTDYLKKIVGHGHPVDVQKVSTMLVAVFSNIAALSVALGTSLDYVCAANIAKLSRRYPNGFSSEASINRPQE